MSSNTSFEQTEKYSNLVSVTGHRRHLVPSFRRLGEGLAARPQPGPKSERGSFSFPGKISASPFSPPGIPVVSLYLRNKSTSDGPNVGTWPSFRGSPAAIGQGPFQSSVIITLFRPSMCVKETRGWLSLGDESRNNKNNNNNNCHITQPEDDAYSTVQLVG